jgi:hypothetical protein
MNTSDHRRKQRDGFESVKLTLKAGHSVRALSRSATKTRLHDPKLEKLDSDALDRDTIERALVTMAEGLCVCSVVNALRRPTGRYRR